MLNRIALEQPRPFPMVLKYTELRSYLFTAIFTLLNVAVPWVFHQFHLAGPTFLPMHIFVFVAALTFGWRFGLIVGLLTPLASYAISGMPQLLVLPQIVVEVSVYGLVAGLLREKFSLRVIWSLLGAILAGRLALLVAALVILVIAGQVFSPTGVQSSPLLMVWSVIKQGWPGIALQLTLIPIALWLIAKLAGKTAKST